MLCVELECIEFRHRDTEAIISDDFGLKVTLHRYNSRATSRVESRRVVSQVCKDKLYANFIMRSFLVKGLALAPALLASHATAAPLADEAYQADEVWNVYPVEVVVAKPTDYQVFCAENGVLPLYEDVAFTVTNAPTTVSTRVTKYSTHRTQTTM